MSTLRLTETIMFVSKKTTALPVGGSFTQVFPGLVDEKYLREDAGDRLVDLALECGVLVPLWLERKL